MAQKKVVKVGLKDLEKGVEAFGGIDEFLQGPEAETSVEVEKSSDSTEDKVVAEQTIEVVSDEVTSQKEEEKPNDFFILSQLKEKAVEEEKVGESKETFAEMCVRAGISESKGIAEYANMFERLEELQTKRDESAKKIQGILSNPRYAPLVEEEQKVISDLDRDIEALKKLLSKVKTDSFLRDKVTERCDLYTVVENKLSDLVDSSFEKTVPPNVRIQSLRTVLEGLRKIVQLSSEKTKDAIRVGAKEFYISLPLTNEDARLSASFKKLQMYSAGIEAMRAKELEPRLHDAAPFLLVVDKGVISFSNGDAFTREEGGKERDLRMSDISSHMDRLGALIFGDKKTDKDEFFWCDIIAEKKMGDGSSIPDYNWGRMLVGLTASGNNEVGMQIFGVFQDEDTYYLHRNITAVEKLFRRRVRSQKENVFEWEDGFPVFIVRSGDFGSITHYYVRESLKHVVRKHIVWKENDEKRAVEKLVQEEERRKENEDFRFRLRDFIDIGKIKNPITFFELGKGFRGTWPYENPKWTPKRIVGHIISDGKFVQYESPARGDDRKNLNLMMFPAPGMKMPLKDFISHPAVKMLARENLLDRKIMSVRKEKRLKEEFGGELKTIEDIFSSQFEKPTTSGVFRCEEKLRSSEWVEFVFRYDADGETLTLLKGLTRFSETIHTQQKVLGMNKEKPYALESLPSNASDFLREAYVSVMHKKLEEAPIWFQPKGLRERLLKNHSSENVESTTTLPDEPMQETVSEAIENVSQSKTTTEDIPLSDYPEFFSKKDLGTLSKAGITNLSQFLDKFSDGFAGIKGIGPKTKEKFEEVHSKFLKTL